LTEKAPHPRDLVPELPKTLDLIVARLLARAPHDRYASVAEVRDLLIPAIALEGGFDDPSWRPATTRSNPTVFIQAAEQPTQEMTPYPGVAKQRRLLRDRRVIGVAAALMIAIGITAIVLTRNARERERQARVLEQAVANKPSAPTVVFTPPAPTPAQIPTKTGASAAAKLADSALPAAAKSAASTISTDLKRPIEDLRSAIESRLPSKLEEVYASYEQDDQTKRYFRGIIDKADSIRVKSIMYQNSNVTGNTAQLNYRMIIDVIANSSKIPTEIPSSWRADLVRDGQKSAWKLHRLTRHVVM